MNTAVYAGTFDPITAGHMSVIKKASCIFEKIIVLIAVNPDKTPLFSVTERIEMINESTVHMPNVVCNYTEGYVIEYAEKIGAKVLVRGIRGKTDAAYETELANVNRELAPGIMTIFIPADPDMSQISSSKLKRIAAEGKSLSSYCPKIVETRLLEKMNDLKKLIVNGY